MNFAFGFESLLISDVLASAALLLILLLIRFVAGRAIKSRTDAAPHLQRRWMANIRNFLLLLALIGLVLIWAPQLQTLALSLTAVAVALVVATKELILCISGSLLRASSRAFVVGDWIEVAGVRGEVVDHNILVTILQEFERDAGSFSHSGRTAVVPNSAFFGSPVRNESLMRHYVYHGFVVTLEPTIDIFGERTRIESLVARHYASLREQADHMRASLAGRSGVDLRDEPLHVRFRTTDIGKYRIAITLLVPRDQAEKLENDIICDMMAMLHDLARHQKSREAELSA